MKIVEILKKSVIPKYYRIYEDLRYEINEGLFEEGDRFPSEIELCEKFKVSRGTIREALRLLYQQGILIREQGKGTFVTHSKIQQDAQQLMGFTELMKRNGKIAQAKLLEVTVKAPNTRVKKLLELTNGENIVKVQRLRLGDDEPLIIERSYFVYEIFKPLLQFNLENESIYELMYRETSMRLGVADQSIEGVLAGPTSSKLLKIERNSPVLLIKRLIKMNNDRLFQYSEDMYRSDRLSFSIHTLPYDERNSEFTNPLKLAAKIG
ncbi:MAG: GntR family transcriptional regulator [Ignavibacteriaceae bacterium]